MAKKRRKTTPKKLCVDVVETQAIVLVDEYGSPRANISCHGSDGETGGSTLIQLFDDEGQPRVSIQVADDTPSIELTNPNGSSAISMAAQSDRSTCGIGIYRDNGIPAITLGTVDKQVDQRLHSVALKIFDESGQQLWDATSGPTPTKSND